ncbi:DUF397 domain-containing protein [Streptomyces sp. NPDC059629]|uniref:DUF397 domain-containing protein n=1 Tax=Streptomyces sp. NPDC059629 TaxID=3346889 RepID=UPI003674DE47
MSAEEPERLAWFKSSYSGNEGGECLETATTHAAVYIRDSKDPARGQLAFRPLEWAAFVQYATKG